MNQKLERCANPFIRLAGMPALMWGMAGLLVSVVIGVWGTYHYHGLLHFGIAPREAWWIHAAERLLVWLVPALLCYAGGKLLSRSHIRAIDVFGTMAFALLPLIGMALLAIPAVPVLTKLDPTLPPEELLAQPGLLMALLCIALGLPFLALSLLWIYQSAKVCCNLKGGRLWITVIACILGGDYLCRWFIGLLY